MSCGNLEIRVKSEEHFEWRLRVEGSHLVSFVYVTPLLAKLVRKKGRALGVSLNFKET